MKKKDGHRKAGIRWAWRSDGEATAPPEAQHIRIELYRGAGSMHTDEQGGLANFGKSGVSLRREQTSGHKLWGVRKKLC